MSHLRICNSRFEPELQTSEGGRSVLMQCNRLNNSEISLEVFSSAISEKRFTLFSFSMTFFYSKSEQSN